MTIVPASIVLLSMKRNEEEKRKRKKKRITNKTDERNTNFVNFFATHFYLKEREKK